MNIGIEAIESVVEYSHLLKSIEFELKINGGWLKPIRLKQLTGILAQDRLEKLYAENKKKYRNFILRSKVNNSENIAEDWRKYFLEEELKEVYENIQDGLEIEQDSSGSDSNPSEDNLEEVEIFQKPVFKTITPYKSNNIIKHKETKKTNCASVNATGKKTVNLLHKNIRNSIEIPNPATSRSAIKKSKDTVLPQFSSRMISKLDSHSDRETPMLSPIIFNTFRKNLGFYQQLLSTKSNLKKGSLEVICKKLTATIKKPKKY